MRFKDKVVVVTGGGTGIGQSAAVAFAQEGAKVMVVGRRMAPLEETVAMIQAAGGEGLACSADITDLAQIEKTVQTVKDKWGRVDVLVNNAGSSMVKPFLEVTEEDFDNTFRIDLKSVYFMTQKYAPLMKENGGGSIINIASILGVFGTKGQSAYCAMKGGVVQTTRATATELGPEIRVNCICPSHIITDMLQPMIDHLSATNKLDKLNKQFPMKRTATPEDMNGAILFFASDESKWLTGNIFMVDGGLSCYV